MNTESIEQVKREFNAAINFAVDRAGIDAGLFLAAWREGDWDVCREYGFQGPFPGDSGSTE